MTFLWVNKYYLFKKTTQRVLSGLEYPEPGSNRHGLLHWCLRPARLPIPPSGPIDLVDSEIDCKGTAFFLIDQIFCKKSEKIFIIVSIFMKNTSYLYNRTRMRVEICVIERKILILHRFLICITVNL